MMSECIFKGNNILYEYLKTTPMNQTNTIIVTTSAIAPSEFDSIFDVDYQHLDNGNHSSREKVKKKLCSK